MLFGAPGTTVTKNTIIGSATNAGFGAINMVDDLGTYNGSFTNVVVSDNDITGHKMFSVGIAMGSCIWSTCSPPHVPLNGPVTITNNNFSGNITFAIPINGWTNGLTVYMIPLSLLWGTWHFDEVANRVR